MLVALYLREGLSLYHANLAKENHERDFVASKHSMVNLKSQNGKMMVYLFSTTL
jgi:hypothetical protein